MHERVTSGYAIQNLHNFIRTIQIRTSVCNTKKLRATRGQPDASTAYDACGAVKYLGHILQVCPCGHDNRCRRHNCVIALLAEQSTKRGWDIFRKPSIKMCAGLRKPDLVMAREGKCIVLDVFVNADNGSLDLEHQRKVTYYDNADIRKFASDRFNINNENTQFVGNIQFVSAITNGRVAWSPLSTEVLSNSVSPSRSDIIILNVKALEGSCMTNNHFKRCTWEDRGTG